MGSSLNFLSPGLQGQFWARILVYSNIHDDCARYFPAVMKKPASTDALEDTINYKAVAKRLFAFVGESKFELVETLAERITELLLNEFDTPWVRLQLNKQGALRGVRDVGIIIERGSRT